CVSKRLRRALQHLQYGPIPCLQSIGILMKSIPQGTFVLILLVTLVVGWGLIICERMVIPVAACGDSSTTSAFLETHGTIFHGKQATVELIVRVLVCLEEGLGIRATARVFEVVPRPCCTGWSKLQSSCGPLPGTFSVRCMAGRYNWTSC